ncbi:MAG: DegT/DnrJ/EryC1/StrS family aminotransferase [Anaerolineales bacterium]|nr:DegT/DnrJ/EryC1/StrS family aminotransferase [Anaerolineales bacterium]
MISLVDLVAQYHSIKEEMDAAVLSTLETGHFILGSHVAKFEENVAAYLGAKHAVGLASGTDALIIALRALEIGAGDEVIIPAYTFFATAGAVMSVGAKPVVVDIDPQSYQIDASRIEAALTPQTRAIMPVHLYGHPSEMKAISEIARKHNLKVIEDNAQAFGAEYFGAKTGALGDVGCLSFFPTKNLGGYGDGGMAVTNDAALAERMRMLRAHGWKKKYYSEMLGYNSRLDALQAAVLQVKLPHVDEWNDKRRALAKRYNEALAPLGLITPIEREGAKHVYHLYVVRVEKRDALQAFLKEKGIASDVYYPIPPHLADPCRKFGYKVGDFPRAEKAAKETLALPLYPELTEAMQDAVIAAAREFVEK